MMFRSLMASRNVPRNTSLALRMSVSTTGESGLSPQTIQESTTQAAAAVRQAICDGHRLLEVDITPQMLKFENLCKSKRGEMYAKSTKCAIIFANALSDLGKVCIVLPNEEDLRFIAEVSEKPHQDKNVAFITIAESHDHPKYSSEKERLAWVNKPITPRPDAALYVILHHSIHHLPRIEKLHQLSSGVPIVLFNQRLNQERCYLGRHLWPPEALHFDFLAHIQPAYYMHSCSINSACDDSDTKEMQYSGLMFRAYPQPYRVFLLSGTRKKDITLVSSSWRRPEAMDFLYRVACAARDPDAYRYHLPPMWWDLPRGDRRGTRLVFCEPRTTNET